VTKLFNEYVIQREKEDAKLDGDTEQKEMAEMQKAVMMAL